MQTVEALVRALRSSTGAPILSEVLSRDGHCCTSCRESDGGSVLRNGRRSRIVLTLAYLDDNPSNVGSIGDRPNVAVLCQRCYASHSAKFMDAAQLAARDAARVRELGPALPGLLY